MSFAAASRRFRFSGTIPLWTALIAALIASQATCGDGGRAYAADVAGSPPSSAAVVPPAASRQASQDLSDLTLLRPLAELQLTQKQVDALIATMKQTVALSASIKKQDDASLADMSAEIARVRADALQGAPVPADFETRLAAAEKASNDRYLAGKAQATKELLTTLSEILTPEQKGRALEWEKSQLNGGYRVPAQYQSDPSKAPPDAVQALALVEVINGSLLFDRTLALLQEYKPASAAAATPKTAADDVAKQPDGSPAGATTASDTAAPPPADASSSTSTAPATPVNP